MTQSPSLNCWCTTCRPPDPADPSSMRLALCPTCGNKRCPRAHNHTLACTNSNAPGQPGSSWEHVRPVHETVACAPRLAGKQTAADRALLELAAKAAGVTHLLGAWFDDGYQAGFLSGRLGNGRSVWNPLNPADAMALAARLRIDVTHNHPADQDAWVCAEPAAGPHGMLPSAMEDVPDEARRLDCMCRAITRAAAAVGEAMP